MPRRKPSLTELLAAVSPRVKPPVLVVLGTLRELLELEQTLEPGFSDYQMDLFPAERVQAEIPRAKVETSADLWNLPAEFQTVIFPAPLRGERALKLDVLEQGFHVLKPGGSFIVLSPYEKDDLFQPALKKVFGTVHSPMNGRNSVFWCARERDRPRRRHEMTFNVRADETTSYTFTSRPGAFSYGRFDHGARALCEAMEIPEGARVLDLGCGIGTNGILAARKAGPAGFIAFLDSNLRSLELAELNARNVGVPNFQTYASAQLKGPEEASFDVVLANPPYFANMSIAQRFVQRGKDFLKPGGTFYLVTKQIEAATKLMEETFGSVDTYEKRTYFIFIAQKK